MFSLKLTKTYVNNHNTNNQNILDNYLYLNIFILVNKKKVTKQFFVTNFIGLNQKI